MLSYHSVSRNDLGSPTSSPRSSPDPELTQKLLSRVRDEFTFTFTEPTDANNDNNSAAQDVVEEEEEEAELVLFAAPTSAAPQARKIRLESPGAGTGEPGFVVKRPRSYYFADELDSEKEEEYKASAIDAQTLLAMAREPWPGCRLPWKVTTISAKGLQKCVLVGHPLSQLMTVEEKAKPRTRKGKKARIALRKKIKERAERKEREEREKREKEEAEREKRTRRNREKKVKKKMRDKAKKAEGAAEGEAAEDAVDAMDVDAAEDAH